MYRKILNFGLSAALAMTVVSPVLITNPYRCFWDSEPEQDLELLRNRLKNRLSIVEYPANTPNEDATQFTQLKNVGGYAVAVFDGHGGSEVSEYLKAHLLELIDQKIKINLQLDIKGDKEQIMNKIITTSIQEAFADAEKYILLQEQDLQGIFKKKQGSCALVALVVDDFLYVANLGDSEAMMLGFEQGKPGVSLLTKKMNINNPYLFNRLRQIYDQKSTFKDLQGKKYITTPEGSSQLTGSFGDLFLKKHIAKLSKQYVDSQKHKKNKKKQSSPMPLLTAKPQISYTQIKSSDAYLLLGTNGFWDQIKQYQIADKFKAQQQISDYAAEEMLENVITNISESISQPQQFIRDLPYDIRPRVFDDISIILVDLKNQTQEKFQV